MRGIQPIQLDDSFQAFDGIVGLPCWLAAFHAFCDWRLRGEVIGRDLHYTTTAVRPQEVIFALLGVDEHVQWTIAITQFGNRGSLDFAARLELAQGELY